MSPRHPPRRRTRLPSVVLQLLPPVFLSALFAAVGVFHVTSRVMVVDAGYRISKLETEVQGLARENDQLKLELATLRSPVRLEKIAREELGMGAPRAGAVVTMARPTVTPFTVMGRAPPSIREHKRDGTALRNAPGGTTR